MKTAEQAVTHQPAISFSNSFHFPSNRAGGRTSNVIQEMKTIILLLLICNFSHASEWKINSITITTKVVPKEFREHVGDSVVNMEIQNTSPKTIKVATNLNWYLATPDFSKYNSICCHPPIYKEIKPNQVIRIRFNDSTKNLNEEKSLYVQGEKGRIFVDRFKLNQAIKNKDNKAEMATPRKPSD